MVTETALSQLTNETVSSVCFVMDYVQIHFNGPILTCYVGPTIENGEVRWTFPQAGSRDALCEIIGERVEAVEVREREVIRIAIGSAHVLIVPLDQTTSETPEAATFTQGFGLPYEVW